MMRRTFESYIEPHGAWTETERLGVEIDSLMVDLQDDEVQVVAMDESLAERLELVVAQARERLRSATPSMTTAGMLDSIEKNARSAIDAVGPLRAGPVQPGQDPVQNMHSRLDAYAADLLMLPTGDRASVSAEVEEARTALVALRREVEQVQASLTEVQLDVGKQALSIQEDQIAPLQRSIGKIESRVGELGDELVDRSETVIEELESSKEEAGRILAAIGGKAVTGGFMAWERSERLAGWLLRLLGVLAAGVAVWLLVTVDIRDLLGEDIGSWQRLTGRIAIGAIPLGIAAYLVGESAKHLENANYARRVSIELNSIGAFVSNKLTDDDQERVLKAFTEGVFGRAEPPSPMRNSLRPRGVSRGLSDG